MRETTLLAIAAAAALLGAGLGYLLLPERPALELAKIAPLLPNTSAMALAKLIPDAEQYDPNSTPEAVHAWRRGDKDAIEQRVSALSTTEAEQLCFLLQLIPRDEVFDKINVKGRLKRHIEDMRFAGEFTEIEVAFNELQRDR